MMIHSASAAAKAKRYLTLSLFVVIIVVSPFCSIDNILRGQQEAPSWFTRMALGGGGVRRGRLYVVGIIRQVPPDGRPLIPLSHYQVSSIACFFPLPRLPSYIRPFVCLHTAGKFNLMIDRM